MDRSLSIELYEDVRVKFLKKRLLISFLAFSLFMALCAVPVIEERLPKWRTLHASQSISSQIESMKASAIQEKKTKRFKFLEQGKFQIENVEKCDSTEVIKVVEQGFWPSFQDSIQILPLSESKKYSLHGMFSEVCFDPALGLYQAQTNRVIVIVPVKDLPLDRLDRASYIILEGESAKISIN